jgi:hypothetical protein
VLGASNSRVNLSRFRARTECPSVSVSDANSRKLLKLQKLNNNDNKREIICLGHYLIISSLVDVVVSAREVPILLEVRVRHLVVGSHSAPINLSILHERVTVHPVIEQQHVIRRVQDGVTSLQLGTVNTVANFLHVIQQDIN